MSESESKIQGIEEGKSRNVKKNQCGNDPEQPGDNKDEHHRRSSRGAQGSNNPKAQLKSDYFGDFKGSSMTVVFHAVLSPHFKFEPSHGDKIFMRFGGAAFGEFLDNVVEVHPER